MSNENPPTSNQERNRPPLYKRQFIVDKVLQYRLIGLMLTVWLANSVFFSIVLYLVFEGHMNLFYDVVPKNGVYPLLALPALLMVSVSFVAVFGVIVTGIVSLYISNQIAGPLYRTKKNLNRLMEGDWTLKFQFRETDFLLDLPPLFNAMMENLRERTASDIELLKAIERASSDGEAGVLARKMREEKQTLLGIGAEEGATEEKRDVVPVAVH